MNSIQIPSHLLKLEPEAPSPHAVDAAPARGPWTRRMFWFYCILWIVEGSLRKWVFPQLSQELLLIRDPLVLLIYISAFVENVLPGNGWLISLGVYAVFSFLQGFAQCYSGEIPLAVAVFGYRTLLLHLPLIWVIPEILTQKDVRRLAQTVLVLAPAFAILMVVQFSVAPDHWLNAGTLSGGGQIGSSGGHIRPAAVFSFITGPIHFYAICTAFCFAGFLSPTKLFPRPLLVTASTATLIAMAVSGSRGLVLGCAVVAGVAILATLKRGSGLLRCIVFLGVMAIVYVCLSSVSFFQEGQAVFAERWSYGEGDIGRETIFSRYFKTFLDGFRWAAIAPPLGYGLGSSSNLAVLGYGKVAPVETEWERIIFEIGAVGGFPYILFRVCFAVSLVVASVRAVRLGDCLCAVLTAACFLDLIAGNFRQSTTLGYVCVCAGLCLAVARQTMHELPTEAELPPDPGPLPPVKPAMQGRGPFSISHSLDK